MPETDIGKSVGRVFAVLELFEHLRLPLTATEVSRRLGYPASSGIGLLKSMTRLGYLSFNRTKLTYLPTPRLVFLSQWLREDVCSDWNLLNLFDEIAVETGESVGLCCESDHHVHYLRLRPGSDMHQFSQLQEGHVSSLFRTVAGLALLSQKSDPAIVKVAEALNWKCKGDVPAPQLHQSLLRAREIRKTGYAIGIGMFSPNIGVMAWNLRSRSDESGLVVAVGGPSQRIEKAEDQIRKSVQKAFARQTNFALAQRM